MKRILDHLKNSQHNFLKENIDSKSASPSIKKLKRTIPGQIILIVIITFFFCSVVNAQQVKTNRVADLLVRELQSTLLLSDKQKDSLHAILHYRANLIDSLKKHPEGGALKKQQVLAKVLVLDLKVDSLFTPAQRDLYKQWKADRRSNKKPINN